MTIPTTQDVSPDGTPVQQAALFRGTYAVVAAPVLAFASLANGQTFVTITPAGAVDSRTINAALAASTTRPTFCAALANDLNTTGGGTTAYVWTVNGTGDGLIGTAKAPGSGFTVIPTGTALVGGVGSITTQGSLALASVASTVASDAEAGARGMVLIGTYIAAGEAHHDFNFAAASYRRLVLLASPVYSGTLQAITLQPNGADTNCVTAGWANATTVPAAVYDIGAGDIVAASLGAMRGANYSGLFAEMRKMPNGAWAFEAKSITLGLSTYGHEFRFGFMPTWTATLRLTPSTGAWTAGSKFALYGEPDSTYSPAAITGVVDVNGATYSATIGDAVLQVRRTTAGACAVTLPAGIAGKQIRIKDSGYWSGTNAITISPTGADTIENGSSYVINIDGDSVLLIYNATTTNWEAV